MLFRSSALEEDDEQDNLLLLPELQALGRFFALPDLLHIYAGETKYLDIDKFLKGLAAIKWEYPEKVQVWYREEHNTTFRLVKGVESADPRIWQRDNLLNEAQDWLEDLETIYANQKDAQGNFAFGWELGQVRGWLEKHKQLRGEE